jgi:hypothetical protein
MPYVSAISCLYSSYTPRSSFRYSTVRHCRLPSLRFLSGQALGDHRVAFLEMSCLVVNHFMGFDLRSQSFRIYRSVKWTAKFHPATPSWRSVPGKTGGPFGDRTWQNLSGNRPFMAVSDVHRYHHLPGRRRCRGPREGIRPPRECWRENGSASASRGRISSVPCGIIVPCGNRDYHISDMRVAEVRQFCKLDETGDSLIRAAMSQLNLSARYHPC